MKNTSPTYESRSDQGDSFVQFGLITLGVALYTISLAFLPLRGDDHHQLASVLAMEHPLSVFVGSWWGEYPYYRPLHTFVLWLVASVFEVRWWPHQALSVGLHLTNTLLLFRLLRLHGSPARLAGLLAGLYLASIHTATTAVWVAARTDLLVGACLLSLLLHTSRRRRAGRGPDLRMVAALCVLAVLGKESGVIVPLVAMWKAWRPVAPKPSKWLDRRLFFTGASILSLYLVLRLMIFGVVAVDTVYEERPILLLGGEDLGEVSPGWILVGHAETVFKNAFALVVPIFDNQGLILSSGRLFSHSPLWLLTPLVLILAWAWPLRPLQVDGLIVLGLASLVHGFFFAHYLLYLGQIGLCLVLGGAQYGVSWRRRTIVEISCALLLLTHLLQTARFQSSRLASERSELTRWALEGVPSDADSDLAEALTRRYLPAVPTDD